MERDRPQLALSLLRAVSVVLVALGPALLTWHGTQFIRGALGTGEYETRCLPAAHGWSACHWSDASVISIAPSGADWNVQVQGPAVGTQMLKVLGERRATLGLTAGTNVALEEFRGRISRLEYAGATATTSEDPREVRRRSVSAMLVFGTWTLLEFVLIGAFSGRWRRAMMQSRYRRPRAAYFRALEASRARYPSNHWR